MNSIMPLYLSLAPDNKYDPVFEQLFGPGRIPFALRPLSVPNDWPFISKWLSRAFGRRFSSYTHLPHQYLRETFATMLQCDFAQPFVGLINDQPAFLVEICDGDKQGDALEGGAHLFEPGDHAMRLILSPTVMHARYWPAHALFISLAYFFTHKQVKRVVWQLHEKDTFFINLAHQLGFMGGRRVKPSFDFSSEERTGIQVYLYLRENFKRFSGLYQRTMPKLP